MSIWRKLDCALVVVIGVVVVVVVVVIVVVVVVVVVVEVVVGGLHSQLSPMEVTSAFVIIVFLD